MSAHTNYPDGTSGHSGEGASKDRAVSERDDGTFSERQESTMRALMFAEERGLTWKELAELRGWHHGQVSAVLSTLHQTGHITRLTERRNRCQVYVLPEHINGREEAPVRKRRSYEEGYEEGYADAMSRMRGQDGGRFV